jgi:hypothetical protein
MVRRWSYINSMNTFYKPSHLEKRRAAFGVTVKSTMYFRKPYAPVSVLSRRRWARRKHLYGWLPLSNVLKHWAQCYRFKRNYLKAITRSHFSTLSFLAFNIISLRNSIPALHLGSESLVISSIPKKILRYFSAYSNPRLRSLLSFKNVNLAFVSLPPSTTITDDVLTTSHSVLFTYDDITSLVTPTAPMTLTQSSHAIALQQLLTIFVQLPIRVLLLVYKLLILLTLSRLL